ncbi:MAG: F0F1 ATP synthase subunit gamma [Gammaproteobacteria bacterium]
MTATSTVAVRGRLRNIDDLGTVVRMMKALSAAAVVQFEQAAQAARDYRMATEQALDLALRAAPPLEPSAPGAHGLLVFGTDQGLVGQFNEHLRDALFDDAACDTGGAPVWVVGRRLADLLPAGRVPAGVFAAPQSPAAATQLVSALLSAFGNAGVSQVELVANQPAARPHYETRRLSLLPAAAAAVRARVSRAWPRRGACPQLVKHGAGTVRALFEEYRFVTLYATCMDSCLAEHSARLAAMQRAEKNIDERRQTLEGLYNRLRQDTVDAELFDLVAGFEALGGGSTARA